jgi:DUF1365 family protein
VTASAIYDGHVRHRRFADGEHEFSYGIALAYVDLDELPALLGGRLVRSSPGLVRFRRDDYLRGESSLTDSVRGLVEQRTGHRPRGPIRMLTQLRSFGHCFNPVSFYYCFDDGRLDTLIAEVTNTPWGERHAYVIDGGRGAMDKSLHVSPFMGMDHRYEVRATAPARTLSVHIESHTGGERAFDATLALHRRELTPRSLAEVTLRYPAAAARVLALIYGQAVRLKLKGATYHPHPSRS